MDYQIVTYDPTTGLATLGIPTVPAVITGTDLLVQVVVLSFLRNPGQNVLSPNEGSGFRADIGQYNTTITGAEIRSLAVQRVKAVQQEVISRQDSNQGTPDERLASLTLTDFAFDSDTASAILSVQITAESGSVLDVLV